MIFQVTLTPYHKDIEPFVPDKSKIIEGIKEISKLLGQEKVYVRYDPILLNENTQWNITFVHLKECVVF